MITEQDVTKLKKVFATKADLAKLDKKFGKRLDSNHKKIDSLDTRLTSVEVKLDGLQEMVGDLKAEVGELKDTVNDINVKIDRFLGTIETVRLEEAAGAVTLTRHTRQIEAIAEYVGYRLPEE